MCAEYLSYDCQDFLNEIHFPSRIRMKEQEIFWPLMPQSTKDLRRDFWHMKLLMQMKWNLWCRVKQYRLGFSFIIHFDVCDFCEKHSPDLEIEIVCEMSFHDYKKTKIFSTNGLPVRYSCDFSSDRHRTDFLQRTPSIQTLQHLFVFWNCYSILWFLMLSTITAIVNEIN